MCCGLLAPGKYIDVRMSMSIPPIIGPWEWTCRAAAQRSPAWLTLEQQRGCIGLPGKASTKAAGNGLLGPCSTASPDSYEANSTSPGISCDGTELSISQLRVIRRRNVSSALLEFKLLASCGPVLMRADTSFRGSVSM